MSKSKPQNDPDIDDVNQSPRKRAKVATHGDDLKASGSNDVRPLCLWGPYLADRQWGTVREDFSRTGDCWKYLSYKDAMKRVYRSGEDGLFGVTDQQGLFCMALALWNFEDPFLKERLFGLTGPQSNHGEDVKEIYYYLDNMPDHSYMKALYRYPQRAYPYEHLITANKDRTSEEPEYEILHTGAFENSAFWDVFVEYAKPSAHTMVCRYTVVNHGKREATLKVIPQFWFRNTWTCRGTGTQDDRKPSLCKVKDGAVLASYSQGDYIIKFYPSKMAATKQSDPKLLFTENEEEETDSPKHKGTSYLKDAFHRYIINGQAEAVNASNVGTKCCAVYTLTVPPGGKCDVAWVITLDIPSKSFPSDLDLGRLFQQAENKADSFYAQKFPSAFTEEMKMISRQAWAGLLWSKQFYIYNVKHWFDKQTAKWHKQTATWHKQTDTGSPKHLTSKNQMSTCGTVHDDVIKTQGDTRSESKLSSSKDDITPGPVSETHWRNKDWQHLDLHDILLMPDKWEFPWFAAWDTCFHAVSVSTLDPTLAKHQLLVLLSDKCMHPSGQIAGCEFDFGDPNPPLQAWACKTIFHRCGDTDFSFLKQCFPPLIRNLNGRISLMERNTKIYVWVENRCLAEKGQGLFNGGFLGMDNISVFDRSKKIPDGYLLAQADATGWMINFCLNMLEIASLLADCYTSDPQYEDQTVWFLEMFQTIATSLNADISTRGCWCEKDSFYYDVLIDSDKSRVPVSIRSLVGLVPLTAQITLKWSRIQRLGKLRLAVEKLLETNSDLVYSDKSIILLSGVPFNRVNKIIHKYLQRETEFLSPYGIRSLSKVYADSPFTLTLGDRTLTLKFTPGESDTDMFGGNSNWRGPVWIPMNYLLMESLIGYSNCSSTGSDMGCLATEICRRMASIFLLDKDKVRPVHGGEAFYTRPGNDNLVLFYEYFHSETGRGCGASHQTGWSTLIVDFLTRLTDR